jgi:hypothetical protein
MQIRSSYLQRRNSAAASMLQFQQLSNSIEATGDPRAVSWSEMLFGLITSVSIVALAVCASARNAAWFSSPKYRSEGRSQERGETTPLVCESDC